ncbi:MAG: hypothetical protein J4G01_09760, partial [Dehalococcoidia bacterium]|nr:hypothetical protein [Dehalococcoidia bacterium]
KLVQGQGTTYVQYLDLLWSVRRAAGMADFPELDRFLWWLAKKGKEGNPSRNGVPAPINGQDPETKIPTK